MFLLWFAAATCVATGICALLGLLIAKAGFPQPLGDRRLGSVDGLRGWLALSVMVHHFFIWTRVSHTGGRWAAPDINFLSQMGAGAVGLFFMTTGLVFYPRILKGWKNTSWTSVYITRFFRIVPLVTFSVFVISLLIVVRVGGVFDLAYAQNAARWIISWDEPNLLGYYDSGRLNAYVLWSLWYEWVFYLLVLPLCAIAMDTTKTARLPTWLVPIGMLCIIAALKIAAKLTGHHLESLRYFPLFAMGMIAYEIQSKDTLRTMLSGRAVSIFALATLVAGMVLFENPYGLGMPLFAFFFTCVACGNSFFGVFRTRYSLVLGEISFSIYLLHGIILDILFTEGREIFPSFSTNQSAIILLAATTIVVPIAAATYIYIEKTAIKVGKNLARWWDARVIRLTPRELDIAP